MGWDGHRHAVRDGGTGLAKHDKFQEKGSMERERESLERWTERERERGRVRERERVR
jgi:hypothetical protein